jgi:hypothetical protein
MARRKRKEDVPEWTAPDFDEVGYMRTEIQAARAAVATIGWAVVGALVAFLLYSVHPALAFFAGILVGFGLYFFLPLIGINITPFKRRDWIGHGITYFFSWLAFWILLLNPPFGDFTNPTIQSISVSPYHPGYAGDLACLPIVSGSVKITIGSGLNDSAYILFRASDNVALASVRVDVAPTGQSPFSLTPTRQTGFNQCAGHRSESYPGGTYNATFVFSASSYSVTIVARDTSGRESSEGFSIVR